MSWVTQMFTSTIGKKYVMALTGLFLCSFLVIHWIGNILLFVPDDGHSFNGFTYFMEHNIIISIMEYVLFAGFIIHILQSYIATRQNSKARPVKYEMLRNTAATPWYSRSMGILGSLVLFFLIIHMKDFWWDLKFGDEITSDPQNKVTILYPKVVNAFHSGLYDLLYVFGVLALGYHLWHGFPSAFRSLGIMHKKYTPAIVWLGRIYTVIITVGFIAMPVYFYFTQFNHK